MKTLKRIALGTIVGAAFVSTSAMSALNLGQWNVAGIQQVCLQSGGTWYGTTFPNWSGRYDTLSVWLFMRGNYDSGNGNDAIVGKGSATSKTISWQEWRDAFAFDNHLVPTTMTFVKTVCDPPAASSGQSIGDPADGLSGGSGL